MLRTATSGVFLLLLLVACLILPAGRPALAHVEPQRSEPAEGEVLEQPPDQIRLFFSEPVEAGLRPLEVYDEQGDRVDRDNARLDRGEPGVLVVDLEEGLPAGSYTVAWRVTGEDGHPVGGEYVFGANLPADEPSAAPVEPDRADEDGFGSLTLYGALGLGALTVLGLLTLRRR